MKSKMIAVGLLTLALTNQVHALGVTEILKTTGESLADSAKISGKSTKNSNTKATTDQTKGTSESTGKTVTNTLETLGDTTEWLICADKCKKLKDEPALVPAAAKRLQGEAISMVDAEKLVRFLNAVREENPQLAQRPEFEEAVLTSLVNGDLE